jgi:hypothetical protein
MEELLRKIFGLGSYEMECDRLKDDNDFLTKELATQKEANVVLADTIVDLQNQIDRLREEPDRIIQEEIVNHSLELDKQYEDFMNHKWYGIGRQDAYREMGIKNIEAHKRGNILVRTPDGEIVEMILGLEDVQEEVPVIDLGTVNIPVDAPDEIEIEDLV